MIVPGMTPEAIDAAGAALFAAERDRTQIGLLLQAHPEMTMEDAYAIQASFCRRKMEGGAKIAGWKIGLTSKAMRLALDINVPDSGVLFDDMLFENGAEIPAGRFIQPRVEAEIAFVMAEPLGGHVTRDEVLAATDYVAPAIEILDTRIIRKDPETGVARKIFDTISDNAANAGVILGDRQDKDADLRWAGAIVSRDGEVEETGLGAGVLDDPALAVSWLAARLAQYDQRIEAGQVVLSGSFIRPIEAPPGSRVDADFGAFGRVSCQFE